VNGLQARILELEERYGSLRELARRLDVDVGYLSRLKTGEKDNPSEFLLINLNLKRVITYEEVK